MKSASSNSLPNRFERRRERTRQELLAAAVRVLARKGLHHTKVTDIAAAADIGVGTFYLHFPTKDALFDAVVDETMQRLKQVVDAARAAAADPIEESRAATAALCRFALQNREVFKIVFGHAAAYNEVIRRAQGFFAADIEKSIRDGIERGVFVEVSPALAAQAMVGMATQMLSWWTDHESVPIDVLEDTIITLALPGLLTRGTNRGGTTNG